MQPMNIKNNSTLIYQDKEGEKKNGVIWLNCYLFNPNFYYHLIYLNMNLGHVAAAAIADDLDHAHDHDHAVVIENVDVHIVVAEVVHVLIVKAPEENHAVVASQRNEKIVAPSQGIISFNLYN